MYELVVEAVHHLQEDLRLVSRQVAWDVQVCHRLGHARQTLQMRLWLRLAQTLVFRAQLRGKRDEPDPSARSAEPAPALDDTVQLRCPSLLAPEDGDVVPALHRVLLLPRAQPPPHDAIPSTKQGERRVAPQHRRAAQIGAEAAHVHIQRRLRLRGASRLDRSVSVHQDGKQDVEHHEEHNQDERVVEDDARERLCDVATSSRCHGDALEHVVASHHVEARVDRALAPVLDVKHR